MHSSSVNDQPGLGGPFVFDVSTLFSGCYTKTTHSVFIGDSNLQL